MKAFKRARREEQAVGRGYQGYALAPLRGVGKVRYSDLSPEAFFRDYVAPRRPVVIDGCLCESEGWQGGKWTNQYLGDKAGDAVVKVEYRGGAEERFGQGRERAMKFGDFLGELERKSDLFYLTTQELGLDSSGRPRVMSAPLDKLKGDFPLRPALAGALVPQNVNLWMGHSKKGAVSSSGLHHDFHDNLYVLLRGKKTFRLFSPADAHRMYVEGELVKVHPNGRINYRGKETRADGSDPLAETAARAAELVDRAAIVAEEMATKAESGARMPVSEVGQQGEERETEQLAMESDRSEREVAAAQEALERGEDGAAERLAAAEEELERALEAVLDAECAGGGGFGEGGSDDESSDSDGGPGFFDGVNDNPSEEVFAAAAAAGRAGRLARENGAGAGAGGGEEGVEDLGSSGGDGEAVAATAKGKGKAGARKTAAAVAAAAISGGADEGRSCSDGGRVTAVPPEGGRGGSSGDGDSSAGDENEDGGAGGAQEGGAERGNGAADPEDGARLGPGAGETEADTAGDKGGGHDGGGGEEASDEKRAPSNFSKVDPSLPRAELAERFPLFLEAESCTVEVEAGQMLFLPAGWFHEVSSMAAEDGHMAFNYWFHPPDAVRASDHDGDDDDGLVDPSKPYESSFWQKDWESRLRDEAEEEEEEGGGASGVVAAS